MPRANNAKPNIRSAYAHDRAREIALWTGMTAAEIIDDALRGYVPPGGVEPAEGLVRRGPILVKPAEGQRRVTQREVDDAMRAEC